MDLLFLVAGLAVLSIPLAVLGAAAAGDPPDLLAGLFRDRHDLGWPIGVQEEDAPPHVPLGDPEPPPARSTGEGAAWRTTVRARVRMGRARR